MGTACLHCARQLVPLPLALYVRQLAALLNAGDGSLVPHQLLGVDCVLKPAIWAGQVEILHSSASGGRGPVSGAAATPHSSQCTYCTL